MKKLSKATMERGYRPTFHTTVGLVVYPTWAVVEALKGDCRRNCNCFKGVAPHPPRRCLVCSLMGLEYVATEEGLQAERALELPRPLRMGGHVSV